MANDIFTTIINRHILRYEKRLLRKNYEYKVEFNSKKIIKTDDILEIISYYNKKIIDPSSKKEIDYFVIKCKLKELEGIFCLSLKYSNYQDLIDII